MALSLLMFSQPAWVLDATRGIREFHHTRWISNDGAPAQISALAQTSDGWLWLGTAGGLYRFDGVAFRRFEATPGQEFTSLEVSTLKATTDGALWVGFQAGGVSVIRGGRNRNYPRGIQSSTVRSIEQDADGTMWIGTMAGLFYLRDDQWHPVALGSAPPVLAINCDGAGTLWVATSDAVFSRREESAEFVRHDHRGGGAADIIAGPGRGVWLVNATDSYGLQRLSVAARGADTQHAQTWTRSSSMLFDRDGALWARCPLGICRLPAVTEVEQRLIPSRLTRDVFTSVEGLTSDYSMTLLEDRDGNIWVGSQRGLDRFRHTNVRASALPRGLAYSFAMTADGEVLAAGQSEGRGELWRLDQPQAKLLRRGQQRYKYVASDGDAVLVNASDGFLTRQGDANREVRFPESAATDAVWFTAPARQGCTWVRFRLSGAYEWCGGDAWQALDARALPSPFPHGISVDRESRLWLGYTGDRIARIGPTQVDLFTQADGLGVGTVRAFHFGRVTLIGGEKGLATFDGRNFHKVPFADGLLFGLTGMLVSSRGDLWLHSQRGLFRIAEEELLGLGANHDRAPRYELFDEEDGLNGAANFSYAHNSLLEDRAGRLWINTADGVAWLDPASIQRNRTPPAIEILSLQFDGRTLQPAGPVALPPRTRDLQVIYTALSLGKPEAVRFRYRLISDEAQSDWKDVGGRREAIYTNLGPGDYRFEVSAANGDGVWNEASAVATFAIPPTFTQTRWFLALCAGAACALLWLAYRIRSRQMARRLRTRMEERMVERERIARELHDTILQSVQGIILDSQTLASRLPETEPARAGIEKTLARAEKTLVEGRDRIRALRTPLTAVVNLEHSLRAWIGEFPQAPGRQIDVSVSGTARALQPLAQEELYRIAQEAVANAVRHSQAEHIEVALRFEPSGFELMVSDNGRGFDPASLATPTGHWGIVGMRERAERLSARFDMQTAPSQGTRLRITLPARRAYVRGVFGES